MDYPIHFHLWWRIQHKDGRAIAAALAVRQLKKHQGGTQSILKFLADEPFEKH